MHHWDVGQVSLAGPWCWLGTNTGSSISSMWWRNKLLVSWGKCLPVLTGGSQTVWVGLPTAVMLWDPLLHPPKRSHTPQTALKCTCAWACELSPWSGLSCFCVLWNRFLFLMCPFFCFEVYGLLNTVFFVCMCMFWVRFWCFYYKFKLFCTLIRKRRVSGVH